MNKNTSPLLQQHSAAVHLQGLALIAHSHTSAVQARTISSPRFSRIATSRALRWVCAARKPFLFTLQVYDNDGQSFSEGQLSKGHLNQKNTSLLPPHVRHKSWHIRASFNYDWKHSRSDTRPARNQASTWFNEHKQVFSGDLLWKGLFLSLSNSRLQWNPVTSISHRSWSSATARNKTIEFWLHPPTRGLPRNGNVLVEMNATHLSREINYGTDQSHLTHNRLWSPWQSRTIFTLCTCTQVWNSLD